MTKHSTILRIPIKYVLLLMTVAAVIAFAVRPYSPENTMDITLISEPNADPLCVLVSDSATFGSVVLASSEKRLICRIHNYLGGQPITFHQGSNTFSWKVVPASGLLFEIPELEPTEFDFEVSIYVGERFGLRKTWITSRRFSSSGIAGTTAPLAEKTSGQSDAP